MGVPSIWQVFCPEEKLKAFIKLKVAEYKTAALSRLLSAIDLYSLSFLWALIFIRTPPT